MAHQQTGFFTQPNMQQQPNRHVAITQQQPQQNFQNQAPGRGRGRGRGNAGYGRGQGFQQRGRGNTNQQRFGGGQQQQQFKQAGFKQGQQVQPSQTEFRFLGMDIKQRSQTGMQNQSAAQQQNFGSMQGGFFGTQQVQGQDMELEMTDQTNAGMQQESQMNSINQNFQQQNQNMPFASNGQGFFSASQQLTQLPSNQSMQIQGSNQFQNQPQQQNQQQTSSFLQPQTQPFQQQNTQQQQQQQQTDTQQRSNLISSQPQSQVGQYEDGAWKILTLTKRDVDRIANPNCDQVVVDIQGGPYEQFGLFSLAYNHKYRPENTQEENLLHLPRKEDCF